MATMTMEPAAVAIEPKIKMAMENIGLGERTDDLLDMLDEIEFDNELAISLAEADRGETFPIEQLEKEVMGKFASGYYGRK